MIDVFYVLLRAGTRDGTDTEMIAQKFHCEEANSPTAPAEDRPRDLPITRPADLSF